MGDSKINDVNKLKNKDNNAYNKAVDELKQLETNVVDLEKRVGTSQTNVDILKLKIEGLNHQIADTQAKISAAKFGDHPVDEKPGDDKPSDDKPSDDKPGNDKPSDDKPSDDKPGMHKPIHQGINQTSSAGDQYLSEDSSGPTLNAIASNKFSLPIGKDGVNENGGTWSHMNSV